VSCIYASLNKQYAQGCKLREVNESGQVVFPANQVPTLPLNPRKWALLDPAPFVAAQLTAVPRLALGTGGLIANMLDMRREVVSAPAVSSQTLWKFVTGPNIL
jgi:hypothetical protein